MVVAHVVELCGAVLEEFVDALVEMSADVPAEVGVERGHQAGRATYTAEVAKNRYGLSSSTVSLSSRPVSVSP
ncbi:hypothetical protein ABT215_28075, partial [Streptomyces sp900105755]|uniref:hypothetical protein n=1 Tax=Streptomyces sp. 900105755 TaxID=3154389 RepID=UPI0033214FBA